MAIASDVSYLISMLCELGNLIFLEKLHLISFLCTSNTSWNRTWCVTNLCLHSNWNSSYDGLVFTVPYFYHAYQRNYSPQNRISGGDCWEIKPFAHSQECWHCYQTKVCELGWRRQEIRWHSAHIFFNARLRRPWVQCIYLMILFNLFPDIIKEDLNIKPCFKKRFKTTFNLD